MFGIALLFVAFVLANFFALWRWTGLWRLAAVLPLSAITYVVGKIVIDTSVSPTSHNLWPFEILIWSGGGLAFLATIQLFYWLSGKRSENNLR